MARFSEGNIRSQIFTTCMIDVSSSRNNHRCQPMHLFQHNNFQIPLELQHRQPHRLLQNLPKICLEFPLQIPRRSYIWDCYEPSKHS